MQNSGIKLIDRERHRGALLIRLQAAVAETGLPDPVIRKMTKITKIGRANYVKIGHVNAEIERLAASPAATATSGSENPRVEESPSASGPQIRAVQ